MRGNEVTFQLIVVKPRAGTPCRITGETKLKPKLHTALLLVATISLAGCGSAVQVRESYTFPSIGQLSTRGVGDSLVEQGTGVLAPEFELAQDANVGKSTIPKGRYDFNAENGTGIWFIGGNQYFYIKKADKTVCIDGKDCTKIEYTLNKKLAQSTLSSDSFQQTLLYNGKIGNKITLAYREFSSGMARSAYSNNVDYDLSESAIVGYKGARREVVKATNTELTYRVLSGFAK